MVAVLCLEIPHGYSVDERNLLSFLLRHKIFMKKVKHLPRVEGELSLQVIMNKLSAFLVVLGLVGSLEGLAQKTCTSNPTTISSDINFGSITWTASGGATVAECNNMADGLITFTGNVIVDVANNKTITITNNVNINGNFPISGGSGSTLSVNGGFTLHVTGDLGDAANNGVAYEVVTASDAIIVDGTLYGKNNNAFTGAGSISGGTLNVKNGSTCGSPCPVSGGFSNCTSGDAFCASNSVLPVTLISFSGHASQNSIILDWATASELNFDFFEVERSTNGKDFMSIGKVSGHGTSNVRHDYVLPDELPLIGKNYYRLKAVDFDRYTEYFNVIAVGFSGDKIFAVSPNPSDGTTVKFVLNFSPDENTSIVVYNNLGMTVGFFLADQNQHSITFSNPLNSGVYYAKIMSKNFTKAERFIVR